MRNKIRLSNICKIGCPLTWKVGKSTKKCSFIHYSFHAYDLHVRARPFSKALLQREQEQKLGQNIFEVAIRLSKCASQNGKFYIESKVGIFNIFFVLSNRVLKLGICRKKNRKYMLQKGFNFIAWVQGKPNILSILHLFSK